MTVGQVETVHIYVDDRYFYLRLLASFYLDFDKGNLIFIRITYSYF